MVILLCLLCLVVGFGFALSGLCFASGEADKRAGLK